MKGSFAGERSVVAAPALDVAVRHGPFFAAAEERVRLREPVAFAGDRLGTEFVSALGVGADVVEGGVLAVALEAYVAPYLSAQGRTLPDGTKVDSNGLVPAEWMLSARTRLKGFTLGIGGGTAIPLSGESRTDPTGARTTNSYAAVTSPEFRIALTLRHTWGAATAP